MDRHVAFLRGMNLGNRRIKNDELRRCFEELDLTDVACFRASGNVIFGAGQADEAKLAKRIEAGLGESLGYEVPVFLRGADELRKVSAHEPFERPALAASKGKIQVVLLERKPAAANRKKALALSSGEDRLAIDGRQLYWLPRGGMSDSELDLKAVGAALGLHTIRTKGTIDQIAAKYFAP
ncbi:MAG TPA: DUF1697 domain-containing protein [Solirubrobacterales bacterium]|nr:DUF1697 domain-containing protein [Solirubrobacterales bacterium]